MSTPDELTVRCVSIICHIIPLYRSSSILAGRAKGSISSRFFPNIVASSRQLGQKLTVLQRQIGLLEQLRSPVGGGRKPCAARGSGDRICSIKPI